MNVVLPGAVKTDMLLSGLGRGHFKDQEQSNQLKVLASNHPLGRVGEPIEIAKTILFLIDSEQSSFITGQTFVVDGGATLRLSTE